MVMYVGEGVPSGGGYVSPVKSQGVLDKGRVASLVDRIDGLCDMVSHIQASARSTGDNLFGPRPETATDSVGKGPPAYGMLDNVSMSLDRLASQIDELGFLVRRFGDL